MLSGKQKRFLRAEAHHLSPIYQVGKNGVSEAMCTDINDALEKRELLKVQVLQNCMDTPKDVAGELSEGMAFKNLVAQRPLGVVIPLVNLPNSDLFAIY